MQSNVCHAHRSPSIHNFFKIKTPQSAVSAIGINRSVYINRGTIGFNSCENKSRVNFSSWIQIIYRLSLWSLRIFANRSIGPFYFDFIRKYARNVISLNATTVFITEKLLQTNYARVWFSRKRVLTRCMRLTISDCDLTPKPAPISCIWNAILWLNGRDIGGRKGTGGKCPLLRRSSKCANCSNEWGARTARRCSWFEHRRGVPWVSNKLQ